MGPSTPCLCPSPGSLWDVQGLGHVEVDENLHWIYLAETGATRQKSKTGFEHVRLPQHLCDSTVAPHSCHSGSGFLTCWTGVGELRRFCDTLSQGCVTGHRPQPQNPRRPKVAIMIILNGGVAVLATSPFSCYYVLYCLLCKQTMQEAKRAAPPKRTKDRPKIDQEEKPQNPKNKGRGWVRIRDIESPKIHRNQAVE